MKLWYTNYNHNFLKYLTCSVISNSINLSLIADNSSHNTCISSHACMHIWMHNSSSHPTGNGRSILTVYGEAEHVLMHQWLPAICLEDFVIHTLYFIYMHTKIYLVFAHSSHCSLVCSCYITCSRCLSPSGLAQIQTSLTLLNSVVLAGSPRVLVSRA